MAKRRKGNKSQEIRDYKATHGEARPGEIAKALKVHPSLVSNVLGRLKGRKKRRKAKRAAGATHANNGQANGMLSVDQLKAAASLLKVSGGIDVAKHVLSVVAGLQ